MINNEQLENHRKMPHGIFLRLIRESLDDIRQKIISKEITSLDETYVLEYIKVKLDNHSYNLQKVVNASGTILHTNLGRAPIARKALKKLE